MKLSVAISVLRFVGMCSFAQAQQVATLFGEHITMASLSPDKAFIAKVKKSNPSLLQNQAFIEHYAFAQFVDKALAKACEHYAQAHKLSASDEMKSQFKQRFADAISDKSAAEQDKIASKQVLQWQVDGALYQQYGGRVIFEQSNPRTPIDAYQQMLKDYQSAGLLVISDSTLEAALWDYFKQANAIVIPAEQVDYSQPWWL